MSSTCFSCWQKRTKAGANSRMSHQGRFVSPEDLEASIFSERGVGSSPSRFDYKKALHGGPHDMSTPQASKGEGNFSLSVDMGTYDKFKSMEQSKNSESEKVPDSSPPKRRTGHNLVRRCFPPVGLTLTMRDSLTIEPNPTSKKVVFEQIRADLSAALNATEDRIRIISAEKGSSVVNLNILGDLGGDMRSPMQLACELVSQARDADSVLRKGVLTSICTEAMIREVAFPVPAAGGKSEGGNTGKAKRSTKDAGAKKTANKPAPSAAPAPNSGNISDERADSLLPRNDSTTAVRNDDFDEFSSGPSHPPRGPNAFRPATPGESPQPAAASPSPAPPGSVPMEAGLPSQSLRPAGGPARNGPTVAADTAHVEQVASISDGVGSERIAPARGQVTALLQGTRKIDDQGVDVKEGKRNTGPSPKSVSGSRPWTVESKLPLDSQSRAAPSSRMQCSEKAENGAMVLRDDEISGSISTLAETKTNEDGHQLSANQPWKEHEHHGPASPMVSPPAHVSKRGDSDGKSFESDSKRNFTVSFITDKMTDDRPIASNRDVTTHSQPFGTTPECRNRNSSMISEAHNIGHHTGINASAVSESLPSVNEVGDSERLALKAAPQDTSSQSGCGSSGKLWSRSNDLGTHHVKIPSSLQDTKDSAVGLELQHQSNLLENAAKPQSNGMEADHSSQHHSELSKSAKPPRPPAPSAKLGDFSTPLPFSRSSPSSSPPMLAPRMSPPIGLHNQSPQNELPDGHANLSNALTRNGGDRTNQGQLSGVQSYPGRLRSEGQFENRELGEEIRLHSSVLSPPDGLSLQPRTDQSRPVPAENHVQPSISASEILVDAMKKDEDESNLYVGPTNPFFASRGSSPAGGNRSAGLQDRHRMQGETSASASAFQQARRAIETAVDESRAIRAGAGQSSHSHFRNVSGDSIQLTATTSRALESQGAASWLQPIMGYVPTQARLTGHPVPRHAEISGIGRRLPPTSNAQAGMSIYYGMASSPVVPKPHAYNIRETEIV